jgi:hypothetical protein
MILDDANFPTPWLERLRLGSDGFTGECRMSLILS